MYHTAAATSSFSTRTHSTTYKHTIVVCVYVCDEGTQTRKEGEEGVLVEHDCRQALKAGLCDRQEVIALGGGGGAWKEGGDRNCWREGTEGVDKGL